MTRFTDTASPEDLRTALQSTRGTYAEVSDQMLEILTCRLLYAERHGEMIPDWRKVAVADFVAALLQRRLSLARDALSRALSDDPPPTIDPMIDDHAHEISQTSLSELIGSLARFTQRRSGSPGSIAR